MGKTVKSKRWKRERRERRRKGLRKIGLTNEGKKEGVTEVTVKRV